MAEPWAFSKDRPNKMTKKKNKMCNDMRSVPPDPKIKLSSRTARSTISTRDTASAAAYERCWASVPKLFGLGDKTQFLSKTQVKREMSNPSRDLQRIALV